MKSLKTAIVVIATLGLQACTQSTVQSGLQPTTTAKKSTQQVALRVNSQDNLVTKQQEEIAKWRAVWQAQLDRIEADRKKRKQNLKKDTKTKTVKAVPAKKRSKPARSRYDALIAKYAKANGVPLRLAHAVVMVESSYRANARGSVGEVGLMQLRIGTARMMGYRGSVKSLYNPETNIKYGMKYLGKAYKLGGGSTCGAILKYNAGHGAKKMNPTSAKYCRRVKRLI